LPQFESKTLNPAISLRWNINATKCDYWVLSCLSSSFINTSISFG
jgi:hypothetical protein